MSSFVNSLSQTSGPCASRDAKASQGTTIRQLGEALEASGIVTLDEKAAILGLSRSTTWTILKGDHKASGLSPRIINRILAQKLPPLVRAKVIEYVEKKTAGCYGHSIVIRRKFVARLSSEKIDIALLEKILEKRAA